MIFIQIYINIKYMLNINILLVFTSVFINVCNIKNNRKINYKKYLKKNFVHYRRIYNFVVFNKISAVRLEALPQKVEYFYARFLTDYDIRVSLPLLTL